MRNWPMKSHGMKMTFFFIHPEKLLNLASRLLQTAFRLLELPFRLLEKLEQKIQAGRRLKRKWESVKKFFRSKMFREALLHAKKEG